MNHQQLLELLKQRIDDPRMLWLIQKFLQAGVMIDGQRHDTDDGVAQGSVLSPLLANVYLHYVLDQWFERDVKLRLRGESHMVRYADDFICAFELASVYSPQVAESGVLTIENFPPRLGDRGRL